MDSTRPPSGPDGADDADDAAWAGPARTTGDATSRATGAASRARRERDGKDGTGTSEGGRTRTHDGSRAQSTTAAVSCQASTGVASTDSSCSFSWLSLPGTAV